MVTRERTAVCGEAQDANFSLRLSAKGGDTVFRERSRSNNERRHHISIAFSSASAMESKVCVYSKYSLLRKSAMIPRIAGSGRAMQVSCPLLGMTLSDARHKRHSSVILYKSNAPLYTLILAVL